MVSLIIAAVVIVAAHPQVQDRPTGDRLFCHTDASLLNIAACGRS